MEKKQKKLTAELMMGMKELMEEQQRMIEDYKLKLSRKVAEKRRWQLAAQSSDEKVRLLTIKIQQLEETLAKKQNQETIILQSPPQIIQSPAAIGGGCGGGIPEMDKYLIKHWSSST